MGSEGKTGDSRDMHEHRHMYDILRCTPLREHENSGLQNVPAHSRLQRAMTGPDAAAHIRTERYQCNDTHRYRGEKQQTC